MTRRGLMAVAGEVSGDIHLGAVVRQLKRHQPDLNIWGIGGNHCADAGMDILVHADEMAVLGIAEVLKRYGFFKRVFTELLDAVDRERPEAVLLVDYPGFNLRLAKELHRRNIKVLYYVCPQVWAWNRKRIKHMSKILDHLMVIFPFEVEVFNDTGLKVEFVGHPLVEEAQAAREADLEPLPWAGDTRIALMPGSRRQEIERHLEVMLDTAQHLLEQHPDSSFILAAASRTLQEEVQTRLSQRSECFQNRVKVVEGQTRQILRQADVALVKSGTGTIEAALQRCPMVIVYKTSGLTYWLGRMLVKLDYLGMVNIVAGKELCPEFIQSEATPKTLSQALQTLLQEEAVRIEMKAGLETVAKSLDRGQAAENVSTVVRSYLA